MVLKAGNVLLPILCAILFVPVSGQIVVDTSIRIPSLEADGYSFLIYEDNVEVTIEIIVLQGNDISFFLTDNENGQKALNYQSFEYYGAQYDINSGRYDTELGPADTYHVVFDNTDSLVSTTIDIMIEAEETASISTGIISLLILGGILITMVIVQKYKQRQ